MGAERVSVGLTTQRVLARHVLATLLLSTGFAIVFVLPVLARLRFGAGDWQTWMITTSVPAVLFASVFWNELLRRMSLRRYLVVYFVVAALPLALIGLAQNFWHLLACHVLAATGFAAWTPASGTLLQRFYPDAIRGRALGVLNVALWVGALVTAYGVGRWLQSDHDAFRVFMPVVAGMHAVGLVLLARLARQAGVERHVSAAPPGRWTRVLAPLLRMRQVLRTDRAFRLYESAFMTYGAGFMICDVLLPVLVTTKLGMNYFEFAGSTQVVWRASMLALALPAGWVLDRLGPARTSAISFVWLALYPLGLVLATSPFQVGLASAVYGLAMAGVHMGWMLGPVSLAPSSEHVPQYVAIHTTLVGVRGILFQTLGMALYRVTGSFDWSFGLAALLFVIAALQMWTLHNRFGAARPAAASATAEDLVTTDAPRRMEQAAARRSV